MISEGLLVDVRRGQFAGLRLGSDGTGCVHQLGACAVAEGKRQRCAGVMIERRNGGIELLADKSRQAVQLTDRTQPHLVLVHLPLLGFQVVGEELHQRIDLVLGTIPVLDGEGVKREVTDA